MKDNKINKNSLFEVPVKVLADERVRNVTRIVTHLYRATFHHDAISDAFLARPARAPACEPGVGQSLAYMEQE